MHIVTVYSQGRILFPREVRESIHAKSGDLLFLTQDGRFVTLAKADNPFDRLVAHAIAEYYAGKAISLDDTLDAADEDAG